MRMCVCVWNVVIWVYIYTSLCVVPIDNIYSICLHVYNDLWAREEFWRGRNLTIFNPSPPLEPLVPVAKHELSITLWDITSTGDITSLLHEYPWKKKFQIEIKPHLKNSATEINLGTSQVTCDYLHLPLSFYCVSLLPAGENKESSLNLNHPARESCALHNNNIIARCARTTSATATAGRQEL